MSIGFFIALPFILSPTRPSVWGQPDDLRPELLDGFHHLDEVPQLHGFGDVTIRVEVVAFEYVLPGAVTTKFDGEGGVHIQMKHDRRGERFFIVCPANNASIGESIDVNDD